MEHLEEDYKKNNVYTIDFDSSREKIVDSTSKKRRFLWKN